MAGVRSPTLRERCCLRCCFAYPVCRSILSLAANVVLVLAASVFEQPQVLLTLMTAIDAGVPIVAAPCCAGASSYGAVEGPSKLARLDSKLSTRCARHASLAQHGTHRRGVSAVQQVRPRRQRARR